MKIKNSANTDRIGVQITGGLFEIAGYIFREQSVSDYGIDAQIEVVQDGEVTGKLIALQIKSGKSQFKEKTAEGYIFRGDREHLDYWLNHSLPVLVVLCDIDNKVCYWQAVTAQSITRTRKSWKMLVPFYQRINPGMDVDLKRLVDIFPVHKSFTVSDIDDVSHGTAKRYSLSIILNKEHTQAEIIDVVRSATKEAQNFDYHRSSSLGEHWRLQSAHVVWLHIYPSAEDAKNNNFLCSTEWISEALSESARPMSQGGECIGDDIKISWNNAYLQFSVYNAIHTMNKGDFIKSVLELTEKTKIIMATTIELLEQFNRSDISTAEWVDAMALKYDGMNDVYMEGISLGLSPFECKDLSIKFQCLIASAHNVHILFNMIDKYTIEQLKFNVNRQIELYSNDLLGFDFELDKVRR
ncbi:DUF4365 domain-containing protein [Pseudoalteromonas rubra]|uniref:DUF4365 domain-containing protein n=1 Tax=Pseudoalteromonas rubra TaxID=43658 RepID=A0A5S3UQ17_9GAMM|nr:DUF4365 domain-containing protein [Pseudoalteromonas rubra]QPB81547.1 DUF4365 domain-containing protein [Pseudoalteromonas rubra]